MTVHESWENALIFRQNSCCTLTSASENEDPLFESLRLQQDSLHFLSLKHNLQIIVRLLINGHYMASLSGYYANQNVIFPIQTKIMQFSTNVI